MVVRSMGKGKGKNNGKGKGTTSMMGKGKGRLQGTVKKTKKAAVVVQSPPSSSSSSSASSSSEEEEEESSEEVEKVVINQVHASTTSSGDDSSDDDNDDDDNDDSSGDEKVKKGKAGFTDENASWLKPKVKPKAKLLDSSDDDDDDEDDDNDDDSNASSSNDNQTDDESDDGNTLLEIERESKLLDQQMEQEKTEADQELRRTIAEHTSTFHLPTPEEVEEEQNGTRLIPPSELRERVDDILTVLSDFKQRREDGRSRTDYIAQLASDLSEVFGYLPELVEYFLTMFNPSETLEFLEASDSPRPLVIRTNTLKCRRKDLAAALLKRGVTIDPLAAWSKVGLKITASPIPIGATPEYLSGMYMLQSAASFCPVLALNPSPDGREKVLDMSAAPGGKTSYIAQLMRNTGTIIANDLKPERQKATVANMHRLGVRNVVTCCYDGRKLGTLWKNRFTKILLDAPCSGLGVISRDPSVKVQRTIKEVQRCGVLQKELLLSAIDALSYKGKDGGIMVYSTCSISVAENEDVVNYVLGKRDVRLLDTGLDFGKPGFTRYQQKRYHPSLSLTRRFYPHVHNMDGFYVAKIQKLSDKRPGDEDEQPKTDDVKVDGEEGEEQIINENGEMEEDEDEDEINWADEVKKVTKKNDKKASNSAKKKEDSESSTGLGKNIKKRQGSNNEQKGKNKKPRAKSNHVSMPPQMEKKKAKKNSTNAKVTKPRRRKPQTEF